MDAKQLGRQSAGVIGPDGAFSDQFAGITKRELLAAMAMQGAISRGHSGQPEYWAEVAVRCADCLLAELVKETP